MVQSDLVTYRGVTVLILFLQATIMIQIFSGVCLNINNTYYTGIIELLTTIAVNKASFNSNFCPTEILKIES